MSPTRDQHLLYLSTEIEKLERRLAGYEDHKLRGEIHLPSYNRTIERKKALEAERDRLNIVSRVSERETSRTIEREAFVRPILDKKGWSTHDWAINSGVDFHTAANYLKGKTKPYKSSRTKLAKSLGVKVQKLPS